VLESVGVEVDAVLNAARRADRVQYSDVVVDADVGELPTTTSSDSGLLSDLVANAHIIGNTGAQRPDKVLAQKAELDVQIVFAVLVAAFDDVLAKERRVCGVNVRIDVRKYAHLAEVVRWRLRPTVAPSRGILTAKNSGEFIYSVKDADHAKLLLGRIFVC